jgi:hypothetical protein
VSDVYVAELEDQSLRLTKDGNPYVAYDIEVCPIYGRDAADRWLEANGYTDRDSWGWSKVEGSSPSIWMKNVIGYGR